MTPLGCARPIARRWRQRLAVAIGRCMVAGLLGTAAAAAAAAAAVPVSEGHAVPEKAPSDQAPATPATPVASAPGWADESLRALPAPHLGGQPLWARFYRPDAGRWPGPRPAVLMLHGCGGLGRDDQPNARHRMWRDWLLDRGLAVLFPLSFSSRGLAQICTVPQAQRSLRLADRVADVLAAQAWLAAQAGIDPQAIVLWGFSHGGSTVLAALTGPEARAAASRFRQAIAFYPGCSVHARAAARGQPATVAAPLLLLIGDADDWTPAEPCGQWVSALVQAGQPAQILRFAGAYHDFDNPSGRVRHRADVPNGVNPGQGVTVGPDPQARAAAQQHIDALLRSWR